MNQRRAIQRLSTWASARSVTSGVGHIIFLISFVFLFNEVLGQTSSLPSGAACVCEGVPCEKNLTAAECPNGRVIPRKDCNCCFVCAKQLTEKCNSNELSCDSDFGLTCGEDGRCQASIPCTDDTTCSNDRFCVGGACADPCRVLPDVCRGEKLINGVCVVRNHRAMCSCSEGMVLDSQAKECFPAIKSSHCSRDGRKIDVGSSYYAEKCSKKCNCEDDGEMSCKNVEKEPDCPKGFVPMSKITGDMSEVCKILIGNDQLFDGCCVPQKCLNATTQEDSKGSRGFRLTESQNNLGDEDDKPKPREMLLGEDERPVLHSDSEEMTTVMSAAKDTRSSAEVSEEDDLSASVKSLKDTVSSTTSSPTSESSLLAGSNPMQVIVLKRTPHSAVIELPKNDNEAQLSIALSAELEKTPENADVWKIHKIPTGLPDITLSDLQPNTSYTLKYSHSNQDLPPVQFMTDDKPDDDESHTMIPDLYNDVTDGTDSAVLEDEAVTGMTTVRDAGTMMTDEEKSPSNETSPSNGTTTTTTDTLKTDLNSTSHCVFNGTTYDSGHVILDGCDQRCECMKDGQMKCVERCSIPFFKKGHFAHDPLCYEEPSGVDECCIIAACARSNINNAAGEARVLKLSPCDTVKCGPNSECRYEVSPSGMQSDQENQETLCVCKEGFSGDAYDETIGCISGPSSTTSAPSPASSKQLSSSPTEKVEGCIFNNKTYEFGAEHFDGCSYKCHCESSGEFLCRPRCTFQRDEEKEIPTGCEVKKDPSDSDGCCEMIVCHGEPLESGSRKENPDIPVDGCVFKNETYEKDAKFYDGCEQQCMCFSNGDVTCQPRCPPAGPNTHDDCITLPDPTDKCCTVTICDPQEKLAMSDVMKAANETLFNSTSTTTTTSAPTTIVPILVPIGRSDDLPTTVQPLTSSSTTTTPKSETADLTETPIFLEESKETVGSPSPSTPLLNTKPVLAKLSMVIPVNETSVMVTISIQEKDLATLDDQMVKIYYSTDMKAWMELEARIKDLYVEGTDDIHTVINGLLPGKEYFFKAKVNETETNILSGYTRTNTGSSEEFEMGSHEVISGEEGDNSGHGSSSSMEDAMCKYKDRFFSYGQEFYDGCDAYCSCEDNGMLKCVPIECPTDLGLELLDANCLRWEPITKNFRKDPPHCCPEMRCVQNSTCSLAGGFQFNNYDEIPQKITGCDKRCYCENGNITCENLCPPMSEKPPADLPCPPEMAMPVTMPPNECCFSWVCRNHPHPNVTDGSPSVDKHLLNRTLTHDTTNMTHLTHNGTLIPYHPDDDQFVPPSTGNQPSFVPLNKINRDQLQDLLHQLSAITADGGGQQHSEEIRPVVPQGTYLSLKDPEQVQELERTAGAKVIEQAEDGSFILFIPSHPVPHRQNPIPIYAHPHPEVLHGHAGPSGFPFGHPFQYEAHPHGPSPNQLGNVMVRALNESTLQIDFTVSPVLVGLHGVVEVLYTKDFVAKTNPDQWERQVFQQAEDLIDNSHLQLFLTGLAPDTEYHLKIQVIMKDIQNAPASELLMIRTPPLAVATTTLPPEIVVDAEVNLVDVTSNTVKVTWRKFTDFEGSLIDGVQIKYRAEQDQVYSTTPLIHRSITNYELTNLQPGQSYEVDLLFIPFTNQTTELRSEKPIHIKTLPEEDLYAFTIAVDAGKVTESSAELIWDGVPYPEDKYVNIYQVIYQSDLQKEQKSTFKVAKRDNNKKAVITDLKPGTRYRVWVEAFLTNGKKKRTNVIDVLTKAGQLPTPDRASQDKLLEDARSKESVAEPGSYYGALVALAIVAALSIIGIVVLLMILIRKQNHAKAPINDRKSESSYDNPSFKNYDLESNGHSKPGDP